MSLMGRTAEATLRMSPLAEVMELAAARLMRASLRDGESSVAVSTELHHAAPSRARDDSLRAVATCTAINGRLYQFTVNVFDESGLVASCEHVRGVVSPRRVEAIARRRHSQASMLLQA